MADKTLDDIKEKVVPILKQAQVKRASLFGSYVRGEETDNSDVDILVDLPKGLNLFDVAGIKLDLEDALGKKVDLVEFDLIKPRIKDQILNEQVPIL